MSDPLNCNELAAKNCICPYTGVLDLDLSHIEIDTVGHITVEAI